MSTIQYRSPFQQWAERAAVRTMDLRGSRWARDGQGDWFPAESWSVANHPEVVARGRRDAVLAALLLGYLDFTFHLESLCIEPASRYIAMHRIGAEYDSAVTRDAVRVQCDEAFHA